MKPRDAKKNKKETCKSQGRGARKMKDVFGGAGDGTHEAAKDATNSKTKGKHEETGIVFFVGRGEKTL